MAGKGRGFPGQVEVEQFELRGQAHVLRHRRVGRIERIQRDVPQQHQRVALLHERRARPVGAAVVSTGIQRAGLGVLTGDVAEIEVAQCRAQLLLVAELPVGADLHAVEPLVFALHLLLAGVGETVGGILQRGQAQGGEHRQAVIAQRGGVLERQAVEVEVVGEQRVGGPVRIAEAAADDIQALERRPRQPGLVQPRILLGQTAAQGLGGGDRAVVVAGGQADAGTGVLAQLGHHAQARTDAPGIVAVFAGVAQRRQAQVGVAVDVVTVAGVDPRPVHFDVAVAVRIQAALVAHAHIALHAQALGPVRHLVRCGPAFGPGLGHHAGLDLLADLIAHGLRDVGHAHVAGLGGNAGGHGGTGRGCFALGFQQQRLAGIGLERTAVDQATDQLDHGALAVAVLGMGGAAGQRQYDAGGNGRTAQARQHGKVG
ncbi:hypothetical protein D3C71_959550 [compost metagenome]